MTIKSQVFYFLRNFKGEFYMKQRRRRGMVFLLCLLCLLWQVGCNKTEDVLNTSIAQMQMNQNKHAEQLHEYDSRYTICYRNTDNTYSMYIFSSPIQIGTAHV